METKNKTIDDLLKALNACEPALKWAKGKTWLEIYSTCERGDWLLWLFKKVNPDDIRLLTLAKGHCAETVIHLMHNQESRNAVYAAIKFGNGEIQKEQLNDYASAAYASYIDIYFADAASYASYASYAAYAAYECMCDQERKKGYLIDCMNCSSGGNNRLVMNWKILN